MKNIANINQMDYDKVNFYLEDQMKSSDMIRALCKKQKVSLAELARRINQKPQNFSKKLNRDTVTLDEMLEIANVMGVSYEQAFILKSGEKIQIQSTDKAFIERKENNG